MPDDFEKSQIRIKSSEEFETQLVSLEYQIQKLSNIIKQKKEQSKQNSINLNIENNILKSLENKNKILRLQKSLIQNIQQSYEKLKLETNEDSKAIYRETILQYQTRINLLNQVLKKEEIIHDYLVESLNKEIQKLDKVKEKYAETIDFIFRGIESRAATILKSVTNSSGEIIKLIAIYILDTFQSIDTLLNNFRKNLGILRTEAKSIRMTNFLDDMRNIYATLYSYGVELENVTESMESLSGITGSFRNVKEDLLSTVSLISANFNVSSKYIAGFLSKISGISKTPLEMSKNILLFARKVTSELGVKYSDVISDISEMGDTTLSIISRIPSKIVLISSELRKLGVSINVVSQSAQKTLDFMENIQEELAASVLIGKNINLQEIRRLYYQGELSKAYEKILELAERIHFEQLNFYQKQQFAQATGVSVENLINSLQIRRNINLAKQNGLLSRELEIIERAKNIKESELQMEGELNENLIKREANLARFELLGRSFMKFFIELSAVLYPVIDGVLKAATAIVQLIPTITRLSLIGSILNKVANIQMFILSSAQSIVGWISKTISLGGKFGGIIMSIASKISPFLKVASFFTKIFTGPIGWLITIADLLFNVNNYLKEGRGLIESFWLALIKPFKDLFGFLKEKFFPGSPSKVGKQIIQGFENTGDVLETVLTKPWENLVDKTKQITKAISSQYEDIPGKISYFPEVNLSDIPEQITTQIRYVPKTKPPELESVVNYKYDTDRLDTDEKHSEKQLLKEILYSIKTLNENLQSGNIRIYVDGQLVNQVIARENAFSKGYGLMNI